MLEQFGMLHARRHTAGHPWSRGQLVAGPSVPLLSPALTNTWHVNARSSPAGSTEFSVHSSSAGLALWGHIHVRGNLELVENAVGVQRVVHLAVQAVLN